MNITDLKESIEKETIYPIIQNNKSIRNKFLNKNNISIMKTLKSKTVFNYFNNSNHKNIKNNNQSKAKSLKVIHGENKSIKMKQFMDKKINNFFSNSKLKNNKKRENISIFPINDEVKNNTDEINDILNGLYKINQKINAINIIKNKKIKNFSRPHKTSNDDIGNIDKKKVLKKEILKINDKPEKTKYKLKLLNNKINNFENENKIINYKTDTNKNEVSKNSDISSFNKKQKYKLKLSLDKIDKEKNSETNSSKKSISKSTDKKSISYNYNNIMHEQTEQNYIDKIRDNEFINLFNKFKKSLKKCKKEEMYHRRSLVFPAETVNYIIKMKNELIIDKYRNEYLKRFDDYKYNKRKILKVIKKCNKSEIKNMENIENTENNIDRSNIDRNNIKNILIQKYDNIKENDKNNDNDSNNYFNDEFNFSFNEKEILEMHY